MSGAPENLDVTEFTLMRFALLVCHCTADLDEGQMVT